MILHPIFYHYNYQYNYNYYHIQIGSIFRRRGVRYIMGICCWTKCCLTTQIIQNIDHIKARWNLLYYSFNVTVKCICWCISVTFWWNRKLFRVLYNSYINLLRDIVNWFLFLHGFRCLGATPTTFPICLMLYKIPLTSVYGIF